ncbi:hypothetical protein JAAARDRAFT_246463 [Jaapia argillacea MUCL 33604]|uniref:Uncharacterized protein n=1 Tax=Jaapia argillacea MUCL 33604 TaxID=933084 RepID=A0A067QD99_9AGAM|nr:hypothetical protein JAAARDRAFT_246463 [Jaapia argillacea MUCL 33604]
MIDSVPDLQWSPGRNPLTAPPKFTPWPRGRHPSNRQFFLPPSYTSTFIIHLKVKFLSVGITTSSRTTESVRFKRDGLHSIGER